MSETTGFIEAVKDKLPKRASVLLSALFFVGTLLVNYSTSRTHLADQLAEQEKRISALEATVKNDVATRREVDDVKATVNRIEDKLDKELEYHRTQK